MTDTTLRTYEFEDGLWIRCNSRGSFINSPALRNVADKYIDRGGTHVVVDLELCPGVDSTFMGTLAGLAKRCREGGGGLEVAGATTRTREAMENLGLDMLLAIDPTEAAWQENLAERREILGRQTAMSDDEHLLPSELQRTQHVLAAHNTLRSINCRNDETFGYVCETLEAELKRHENRTDEGTSS